MALMGILTVLLQADIIHVSHHQIVDSLPETTNIPGCNLTALKKQNKTHKKTFYISTYLLSFTKGKTSIHHASLIQHTTKK